MTFTVQQVLDLARVPLNDASKARYLDAQLLGYYNAGMVRLYELRPDLLIGSNWSGSAFTLVTTTTVAAATLPVNDRFAQPLADYMGARAEMKDEDAAVSGRATALMQMFVSGVTA